MLKAISNVLSHTDKKSGVLQWMQKYLENTSNTNMFSLPVDVLFISNLFMSAVCMKDVFIYFMAVLLLEQIYLNTTSVLIKSLECDPLKALLERLQIYLGLYHC